MQLYVHNEMTEAIFGKPYEEIHIWLDDCYPDYAYNGKNAHYGSVHYHRIERHNLQAIHEKYGKDTIESKVAILHCIVDFIFAYGEYYLPINKEDCLTFLKTTYIANI